MKVCVFCSSRPHLVEDLAQPGEAFVNTLVDQKMEMIYGGSSGGLMGHLADGVLERGGRVTGIFPKGLFPSEVAHKGLSEFIETENLLDRKQKMMSLADGFVIFPGGVGTLDEALEVLTWRSLGQLNKPIIFFNWQGFWDSFIGCLKDLERRQVLYPEAFQSFSVVNSVDEIFRGLRDF